jgi:hypothetical protein
MLLHIDLHLFLHGVSYQARITDQLRRLGGSCDWDRVAFTMSPVRNFNVSLTFLTNGCTSHYQKPLLRRSVGFTRMVSSTAPIDLLIGVLR